MTASTNILMFFNLSARSIVCARGDQPKTPRFVSKGCRSLCRNAWTFSGSGSA